MLVFFTHLTEEQNEIASRIWEMQYKLKKKNGGLQYAPQNMQVKMFIYTER